MLPSIIYGELENMNLKLKKEIDINDIKDVIEIE